jgi:hypothetical protein
MTNNEKDRDAFDDLADAWRSLPEDQRKKVFKAVYKFSPVFFNKLTKEIKGFTSKYLVTRPTSMITRLDNLLITMEGGNELTQLMRVYFTNCNPSINENFTSNFRAMTDKSPHLPSKLVTEKVFTLLDSEFKEDPLWDIYKKALSVCEPSRFSDVPPDPEELNFPPLNLT